MNKNDLISGKHVIETRCGNKELFIGDKFITSYYSRSMCDYDENFKNKVNTDVDIVKIYEIKTCISLNSMLSGNNLKLIWAENMKKDRPSKGDVYYRMYGNGDIDICRWNDDKVDNDYWDLGFGFFTKEEAEFKREKIKIEEELKRFAKKHNNREIDWTDFEQTKYCIVWDHCSKKFLKYFYATEKMNNVYFTSAELCEKAIKEIGEDRIKKYYFEIK